jgi:hypothetical protein
VRLTDCINSKHLRILLNSHSNNVGLVGLWQELKRGHIDRVATFYAVVIWLMLDFPITLTIVRAFELTPQGIKATV